jgi:outer membrane protein assembly factor BamB
VVAPLAVILAGVGAVVLFTPRDRPEGDLNLPPDLSGPPELGRVFDPAELIEGEFDQTKFLSLMDQEIGFVYGVADAGNNWYWQYGGEYETGPQDDEQTIAAIAAFDLSTGEQLWQIDLEEELTLKRAYGAVELEALPIDGETFALIAEQHPSNGAGFHTLATISRDGAILARQTHIGTGWATSAGGNVLWQTGWDWIAAYAPTKLGSPIWGHVLNEGGLFRTANSLTGTWWIRTDQGWVDPATGEPLALGEDARLDLHLSYLLATGDSDVLLRYDQNTNTLRRVDPDTDEWTWQAALPVGYEFRGEALVNGDNLAVFETHINSDPRGEDGLDLPNTLGLTVADARTGEPKWSTPDLGEANTVVGAATGCLLVRGDAGVTCLDWTTGEVKAALPPTDRAEEFVLASRMLYVTDDAGWLRALDTEDSLREAWALQLPAPAAQAEDHEVYVSLDWWGDRLFAEVHRSGKPIMFELKRP